MKKILIGVAWPYANGNLHIGHLAGYLLPADIFGRFQRLIGNDVLMVSGSDCFGTPITLEADQRSVSPREIGDEYHERHKELFKLLHISFDLFTKTDTDNHRALVQEFFVRLLEKGLIYKDKMQQYYSPAEQRFLPDRYVEGKCPICGFDNARSDQCDQCGSILEQAELQDPRSKISNTPVQLRFTQHYFLDWPKLQEFLQQYVLQSKNWRPWVFNETLQWLNRGLKPRAITRDLDWGVEIPIERIPVELQIENAQNKRIYVWFDAVIGYLSASIEWALLQQQNHSPSASWEQTLQGEALKDFWYNKKAQHYYFMGKDNLVFHTLFWPGQLHGYDKHLHLPDIPAINQFLTLEGQKFSKSRGVSIDSKYIVEQYGLDPVRFYLCLIMPEDADANFRWADFVRTHNDILIGNVGNFIHRTLTLAQGMKISVRSSSDPRVNAEVIERIAEAKTVLGRCEFKKFLQSLLQLSEFGNKYIATTEPWMLKKTDTQGFEEVLRDCLLITASLALLLKPLLPYSSQKLSQMLGIDIRTWPENEISYLTSFLPHISVTEVKPLFEKIDERVIEEERSKISPPSLLQGNPS